MVYAKKKSGLEKYQKVSSSGAEFATPHRIVQMLMEGALDKISAAKGAMDRKDIDQRQSQINWAISIIDGLRGSLNLEVGGEVAANLENLYEYMTRRLAEASVAEDTVALDEVTSLLKEIKGAWDVMPQYIQDAASVDEIKEKMQSEQEA